jgi:hypothetical protein
MEIYVKSRSNLDHICYVTVCLETDYILAEVFIVPFSPSRKMPQIKSRSLPSEASLIHYSPIPAM